MSLTQQGKFVNHPGEILHIVHLTTLNWQVIPQNWTSVRYGIFLIFDLKGGINGHKQE